MKDPTQTRRVDVIEAGYYAVRVTRKGPWVGALIELGGWVGPGWHAVINGEYQGFPTMDPWDSDAMVRIHTYGKKITEAQYVALLTGQPVNLA